MPALRGGYVLHRRLDAPPRGGLFSLPSKGAWCSTFSYDVEEMTDEFSASNMHFVQSVDCADQSRKTLHKPRLWQGCLLYVCRKKDAFLLGLFESDDRPDSAGSAANHRRSSTAQSRNHLSALRIPNAGPLQRMWQLSA